MRAIIAGSGPKYTDVSPVTTDASDSPPPR
jgi:hypothetical protein